jgi:hypothetical protein
VARRDNGTLERAAWFPFGLGEGAGRYEAWRPAVGQMPGLPCGEVAVPLLYVDHVLAIPFGHTVSCLMNVGAGIVVRQLVPPQGLTWLSGAVDEPSCAGGLASRLSP